MRARSTTNVRPHHAWVASLIGDPILRLLAIAAPHVPRLSVGIAVGHLPPAHRGEHTADRAVISLRLEGGRHVLAFARYGRPLVFRLLLAHRHASLGFGSDALR